MMKAIARGIRDFWIAAGVALVLFISIEAAYRAQSQFRHTLATRAARRAPHPPDNPFDSTAWWTDYWDELIRVKAGLIWEPYLYVRNPVFPGKYITVDSLGHRVTPVPPSNAVRPLRVFFFGGSTMFGWFQRNEHTIPVEAARRLQAAIGEQARVLPTNFAVPGRVFTQEVLELMLQLRRGERPDIVVFYDGVNEIVTAVENGQAGLTMNEANRVDDFRRGRELAEDADPGLANDRKWAVRVLEIAADRIQFVRSIGRHMHPSSSPQLISTDSAARGVLSTYAGTAAIVEALAKQYGFQPIYVWQPALLTMTKPLTARETYLVRTALTRRDIVQIRDLHVMMPPLITAAMTSLAGPRFIDETHIFKDDSLDVYEDMIGHTYERATPAIVDSIMPALTAAARRKLRLSGGESLAGATIH
jgi:hypothetical protein